MKKAEIENIHGVGKRQWAKWSPAQRLMFNYTYQNMESEDIYKHPQAPRCLSHEHWNTIRWNAAFMAAANYGTVRKIEGQLSP